MENKRNFFRLDVYNVKVSVNDNQYMGQINDLSGIGISFTLDDKIDAQTFSVSFELENEQFHRKARIVRYTREKEGHFYGCEFSKATEKEVSALARTLFKMESKRINR